MTGPDTLDVPLVDNPGFEIHGQAPVPSVVDFQIDTMAIIYMTSQLNVLTRQLEEKIFGKDSIRAWYEVFLAAFVLLSTLESVHQTQISYLHANANGVSIFPQSDLSSRTRWLSLAKGWSDCYSGQLCDYFNDKGVGILCEESDLSFPMYFEGHGSFCAVMGARKRK